MRISTQSPQAILTASIIRDGSPEKKDEKKSEAKATDSKNIFHLEPYLESIEKNSAISIDLSEQKDSAYRCKKVITKKDYYVHWSNESIFSKRKVIEDKESYRPYGICQFILLSNGQFASMSENKIIRFWDSTTGECIKNLNLKMLDYDIGNLREGCMLYFAVLSNGQLAVAAQPWPSEAYLGSPPCYSPISLNLRKRIIDIWDIDAGKRVAQLKSKDYMFHKQGKPGVLCLQSLPNEQLLVLGIKGIEIWDVKKQKILHTVDRKHLGETSFDKVRLYYLPAHGTVQILAGGNIVSFQDGTIDVWDKIKNSLKQKNVYSKELAVPGPMAVLPDGRIAIPQWIEMGTDSTSGKTDIYNPPSVQFLAKFDEIDKESYRKFSSNTKEKLVGFLLLIGIYDQECKHIDNFGPIAFYKGTKNFPVLSQLLLLLNGNLLSATTDKKVQIWDTKNGKCINTLEYSDLKAEQKSTTERALISIIELPDGRLVTGCAFGHDSDKSIGFWESGGPIQLRTIEPLLTALKTNTSVTTLNLQNTAVDDNIIPFIVELWKTNFSLKKIDLRNTAVSVDGIRKLFQLTQPQLSSVRLWIAGSTPDRKEDNSGLLELIQHPGIEILKAEKREAAIKEKAKAEADERARREAEIKAKAQAEAAEKARKEAEIKAKMEAEERAYKQEQARIKAAAEAEEKLRKEQELKARQEAEEKRRQEEKQKQLQELHKKGELGDVAAQLDLANRYEKGDEVAKDPQKALYWYKKAAEQNEDMAQQKLGEYFEKGLVGKKDYAQAYFWYQKAADQGNDAACAGLKSLKDKGYSPPPSAEFKQTTTTDKSPVTPGSSIVKETKTEAKDDMTSAVSFEINYDQLNLGKELGRGGFGIVYQGTWRFNNVAIKQLLTKSLSTDALEEFNSESRIMAQLRSEYVVQFYGRCVTPTYCLVMQYMPKGSLFNLLRSREPLDWSLRYRMLTDIACGLAFLHASNIFHRDLKSLNVLLDENYRTKLCDFGLSKVKSENQSTATMGGPVGTLPWMAPELFERRAIFTAKADIYSLAMTLWEIASRKTPFADASSPSLIPMWVTQGQREEIPSDTPPKISSLIRCCWHADPAKRPTAAEVVTYLRSDQTEFKSTGAAPSASTTTSIQGNLASGVSTDLGSSSSIHANLMSVTVV